MDLPLGIGQQLLVSLGHLFISLLTVLKDFSGPDVCFVIPTILFLQSLEDQA